MTAVRELIQKRVTELGKNLAEVSLAIGKNHAYLQQYLKRGIPRRLPEETREALARVLEIPESAMKEAGAISARLATVNGTAIPQESNVTNPTNGVSQSSDRFKPLDIPIAGRNAEMPLYRFAQGGRGTPILEDQPFETVFRPDYLSKVRDPYGVMVEGTSMVPEYYPGWIAHIDPNLVARPGDTCIFRGEQEDGSQIAVIKVLRRETDTLWHVEQHNPGRGEKRSYSLKKAEFQVAHVTTGADRRRR